MFSLHFLRGNCRVYFLHAIESIASLAVCCCSRVMLPTDNDGWLFFVFCSNIASSFNFILLIILIKLKNWLQVRNSSRFPRQYHRRYVKTETSKRIPAISHYKRGVWDKIGRVYGRMSVKIYFSSPYEDSTGFETCEMEKVTGWASRAFGDKRYAWT